MRTTLIASSFLSSVAHPSEANSVMRYCVAKSTPEALTLPYKVLFALKQLQVNCLSFGFESKVSFRYDLLKL